MNGLLVHKKRELSYFYLRHMYTALTPRPFNKWQCITGTSKFYSRAAHGNEYNHSRFNKAISPEPTFNGSIGFCSLFIAFQFIGHGSPFG